jgi:hypothetical protein
VELSGPFFGLLQSLKHLSIVWKVRHEEMKTFRS